MNCTPHIKQCLAGFISGLFLLGPGVYVKAQSVPSQRPNVLFIVVDDLKPELGCYGSAVVQSPGIDKLASASTVFTSAYCQQAICGPTRTSVLTGLRPDRTEVWDLKTKFREVHPELVTLPQYFRENGYRTIGMGKVFDPSNTDREGDRQSWVDPFRKIFTLAPGYEKIAFGIYQSPEVKRIMKDEGIENDDESGFYGPDKNPKIRFSTECLDVPDNAYMDGAMADEAVVLLEELSKGNQPFFLALGFKKPHLPFVAPKKYWDLYDRSRISLAAFREKAENSPDIAYHNSGELRNYAADIHPLDEKGNLLRLDEEKQRELIHGYYACVSYTDAQVAKVMAALKANGLDRNTMIILWGDHGWHLGDHSLWCKHSNFEQATHAPLIIHAPGQEKGHRYDHPVEFVDIYPTVVRLAGLDLPAGLDGISLEPVLRGQQLSIHDFAVSQYPRGFAGDPRGVMGYSLRNTRYRYTEWVGGKFTSVQPFDLSAVRATELYDYQEDPLETNNLSGDPAYKKISDELAEQLHAFYRKQHQKKSAAIKIN